MADSKRAGFKELAKKASMQPQEALLEINKSNKSLHIGVPKEITYEEKRVALTPSSVQLLVSNGHEVTLETKAGEAAHFTDSEYSEAGAKIAYSVTDVYKSDIIVKVDPPTEEEIRLMRPEQLIFSAIQQTTLRDTYIKCLMQKKVTAVAFEYMRDDAFTIPIVRSMSEIAGTTSILIASEYLSSANGGKGEMLGGVTGIPPSEVVIIGAGTVGEFAAMAALGLGASVKVFDKSTNKLRRLQTNVGARVSTSLLHPKILEKALHNADVAVGALRSDDGRSPSVVTEQMVMKMKAGSVIIDVSIDQGGCFETSELTNHTNPIFTKHDVIHYCVPNIPSRVARTASYALSNILTPVLLGIADEGGFQNYIWDKAGLRNGVYIYKGNLTNRNIGQRLHIPDKDIDLLIAAHL
ncbi:MAG TPA: alanine dehydrogenase [Bacteroidia bacterium]|nr:alanine dehydrogenase [Bacteroidia bacterium]